MGDLDSCVKEQEIKKTCVYICRKLTVEKKMDESIITSLDIGTTKITCIISHLDSKGRLNVLGVGVSPSTGLKKGVVINIEKTVNSIRKAVEEAKRLAGVDVDSVWVGITGDHIQSVRSNGIIPISHKGREIKEIDIIRAIDVAQAISIPMDREILHVIPQEFIVDDRRGINDPKGMFGVRLEARVHICTGAVTGAQNIYKSVNKAGYKVKDLVLDPLASSYAVLGKDERELGVALIDIGGGTTDLVVYSDNSFRYTAVIGLGGNDVTRDIAGKIRISNDKAEELKRQYGCAYSPLVHKGEYVSIPRVGGRKEEKISRLKLSSITEPRLKEILSLAVQEIRKNHFIEMLGAGVVLTGGGALMEGCVELAGEVFKMPARIGTPSGFGGLVEAADTPAFATGIGLCMYGVASKKDKRRELLFGADDNLKKIVSKMKSWISHFKYNN
jgi:cell division protein FtsA